MKFDGGGPIPIMGQAEKKSQERPLTFEQQVELAARNLYTKFKKDGTLDVWERLLGEVRDEWVDTRAMTIKAKRARRLAMEQEKKDALKNRNPDLVKKSVMDQLNDPQKWLTVSSLGEAGEDRRFAISSIWHYMAERLKEEGRPALYWMIAQTVNEWYG